MRRYWRWRRRRRAILRGVPVEERARLLARLAVSFEEPVLTGVLMVLRALQEDAADSAGIPGQPDQTLRSFAAQMQAFKEAQEVLLNTVEEARRKVLGKEGGKRRDSAE